MAAEGPDDQCQRRRLGRQPASEAEIVDLIEAGQRDLDVLPWVDVVSSLRIGVAGDWHGNRPWALRCVQTMADAGIGEIFYAAHSMTTGSSAVRSSTS